MFELVLICSLNILNKRNAREALLLRRLSKVETKEQAKMAAPA